MLETDGAVMEREGELRRCCHPCKEREEEEEKGEEEKIPTATEESQTRPKPDFFLPMLPPWGGNGVGQ